MTQCFDKTTKLSFRNSNEPSYIKFGTGRDRDPSVGIRSGQLRLPGYVRLFCYAGSLIGAPREEVAALFQPSIDGIVDAIEKQREAAHHPISVCFHCTHPTCLEV